MADKQDKLLNEARKNKDKVRVYLTNGAQLEGIIQGFDNFVVILEFKGRQNMIYKHAISTITM